MPECFLEIAVFSFVLLSCHAQDEYNHLHPSSFELSCMRQISRGCIMGLNSQENADLWTPIIQFRRYSDRVRFIMGVHIPKRLSSRRIAALGRLHRRLKQLSATHHSKYSAIAIVPYRNDPADTAPYHTGVIISFVSNQCATLGIRCGVWINEATVVNNISCSIHQPLFRRCKHWKGNNMAAIWADDIVKCFWWW